MTEPEDRIEPPSAAAPDAAPHAVPACSVETERTLIATFIGPNWEAYRPTWEQMGQKDPTLAKLVAGWHWPCFLVTLPWLLYRKQWAYAAALVFVPIAIEYLLPDVVPNGAYTALFVVLAMYAKSLYVAEAARAAKKLSSEIADPARLAERLARAGGVSTAGAVVGSIMYAFAIAVAVIVVMEKV